MYQLYLNIPNHVNHNTDIVLTDIDIKINDILVFTSMLLRYVFVLKSIFFFFFSNATKSRENVRLSCGMKAPLPGCYRRRR